MRGSIKERIVDSALDLFGDSGFHVVSVEDIVERAKTSKGGFYYYFKSKKDLLYEIHDIFISYVLEETKRACQQYVRSLDQLVTLMNTFMSTFQIYQRHITVFYNESAFLEPQHEAIINNKRTAYRKLLEEIIDSGIAQGDFREQLSPSITAMLIIGTVNWTYKWYDANGPLSMGEIRDYFNDVILRGLLTEVGLVEALNKQYVFG